MALKLYRLTEDGKIAESGWFEPEDSRKKRDNGWVTVLPERKTEPTVKTFGNGTMTVVNPDAIGMAVEIKEKELDKPEETKVKTKEIKKHKSQEKKRVKKGKR